MEKIKVIVTDDQVNYRKAVVEMLDSLPVSVIGEAENGRELISLLKKKQPHIVLLDLQMPIMDGNETFEYLGKHFPDIKVIILSYYFESILADHYLRRGAKGYISKDMLDPEFIMDALTKVHNGGIFLHQQLPPKREYTLRQEEIMPLIFEGLTNDQIADKIHISKRAVEKQRYKIYQKSGSGKAIEFYKYAFARGLQFLGKSGQEKQ